MIEVVYTCRCCKKPLKSRASYRGRRASCPLCGEIFIVPVQGGVVAIPVQPLPPIPPLPPYPYHAKEENRESSDQFVRGMLAFAGAFLMGLGIGALVTATVLAGRG